MSGFVAHDLSGSCFTCMGGEHEVCIHQEDFREEGVAGKVAGKPNC